ncbi:hypothetical protein VKT23_019028 [Stygiomarasmius scandens]|uniref:Uncharacterized protein n=1 Tax=Marasmiellus scandens TaxID=2682957 RepID=A0ABR1IPN3_9AGAR
MRMLVRKPLELLKQQEEDFSQTPLEFHSTMFWEKTRMALPYTVVSEEQIQLKGVGHVNRTGRRYYNHFDNWCQDEIVEYALELGTRTSFPTPAVLSTRIETSEVFGIIPIPEQTAKDYQIKTISGSVVIGVPKYCDTPSHLRIHLNTAPLSPYIFLKQQQRTAHAVVPIHTKAEYKLFNEFIRSTQISNPGKSATKSVNFGRMASEWNVHVNELYISSQASDQSTSIYYKLPEQLEQHYKVWLAYMAENATLFNSESIRQAATQILNDPTRYSTTLPPIPTPITQKPDLKGKGKASEVTGVHSRISAEIPQDIEMHDAAGSDIEMLDIDVAETQVSVRDVQEMITSSNQTIFSSGLPMQAEASSSAQATIEPSKKKDDSQHSKAKRSCAAC